MKHRSACRTKAATRAQARPMAVAERHGHNASRAARQIRLRQLPCRRALARARKAPPDLFRHGWPPQLPYGGSTRFYGVQLGGKGHLGWFVGAAAAVRELPGSSGRRSPCLPGDGALRCGCRRPVPACSSIPADRDHRFRRSGTRPGHAARAAPPLFACGMPTRAALVVLAWTGDGSPIRGCTTSEGVQVPLGHEYWCDFPNTRTA